MTEYPYISVVIPCFNEEKFISSLLSNLMEQDYPKDKVEIILADGNSTDNTKSIIEKMGQTISYVKCIDNPDRFVSPGLNAAIKMSTGEVVVRMDAHSIYPSNYWTVLVEKLFLHKADNVGGVWITMRGADTIEARAIVLASSHPLGIGNARYRLGASDDVEVDTVPYGCFRRDVFERIGFFDTDLHRNQDDEFNGRIKKNGGKIVLVPTIEIKYFARENFDKLSTMFYQYGLYKPLVNLKLGAPATMRQFAPPMLVMSLTLLLLAGFFLSLAAVLFWMECVVYFLAITAVSMKIAGLKERKLLLYTMATFPVIHFSFGLGYIFGWMKFTILRRHHHADFGAIKTNR